VLIRSPANQVSGHFIGTNVAGTAAAANTSQGIEIVGSNNVIGGTTAAARNLISGNNLGLEISDGTSNQIQGNFVGTTVSGNVALGNTFDGLKISAPLNTIGGTTAGSRNVISGNGLNGVDMVGGDIGSALNLVQGNIIGIDATGAAPLLSNPQVGVFIQNADSNTVGGTTAAARNIISSNSTG